MTTREEALRFQSLQTPPLFTFSVGSEDFNQDGSTLTDPPPDVSSDWDEHHQL
jgi:hypothetical protein